MKLTETGSFEDYAKLVQSWYEDAKKWNQTLQDTTPNEIVKRLRKYKKKVDVLGWDNANIPPTIFNIILGEK